MGKMMTAILSAFAEMERDLISQRTLEGLARARAQGKHLGRPFGATHRMLKVDEVLELANAGLNKTRIANLLNCDRNTVHRFCRENNIDVKCKTSKRI